MGNGRTIIVVWATIASLALSAKELPTQQKNRELVNGKPRIQIWTPDPIDVEFDFAKHRKNKNKPNDDATSRLIDSTGKNKKKQKPKAEITFNENAPKKSGKSDSKPDDGADNNPPMTPPAGGGQSVGQTEAFAKWYPVCLFADETLDPGVVNDGVKGLADAGAACGVNVIVFPVTIRTGYGDDPDTINKYSTSWCNLDSIGASVGSATACVPYPLSADKMCDPNWRNKPNGPDPASGCAMVRGGQEAEIQRWRIRNPGNDNIGQGHSGGGDGSGILASIEDNRDCSKSLVNHEAIGHSALGWPNKKVNEAGFGIEDIGGGGGGSDNNWSGSACARLKQVALTNDGRWRYDRNRQTYYVPAKEPITLLSDGKLFGPPKLPASAPKIIVNNGAPMEDVFSADFFDDKPKAADSPAASLALTGDPEKHKKRAGSSMDESAGGKQVSTRADDIKVGAEVPTPPNSGRPSSRQTLTMDEGAKEGSSKDSQVNTSSNNDTNDSMAAEASARSSSGSASSASLGYDESAKEGGNTPRPGRTRVLRGEKGKELDPNFFRTKGRKPANQSRDKGSSLRKSEVEK